MFFIYFESLLLLTVTCTITFGSGVTIQHLDSDYRYANWTVTNADNKYVMPGRVPGGIYSDMMNSNLIPDIFKMDYDVAYRWVAKETWTYTAIFNVTIQQQNVRLINLVFEGVDTIADILLNDVLIGKINNMFVRYVLDVKHHLKLGLNELQVKFTPPMTEAKRRSSEFYTPPECVPSNYNGECHVNQLRKMQASFGWDWGPAFPSVGIWKSVYLEYYNTTIIRSLTTAITKRSRIWTLRVKVHLETEKNYDVKGKTEVTLFGKRDNFTSVIDIHIPNSNGKIVIEHILLVHEQDVNAWWPNGYGIPYLYNVSAVYTSYKEGHEYETSTKDIRIGFRLVDLIDDWAFKVLGNATGGKGRLYFIAVNGYPLFMKGSNWIPSHILPEYSYDPKTVDELLESAQEAHMNMLRVWGGGLYESDYFYRRCDELGILIWQDLMFACSMYPVDEEFLTSVKEEITQNVIRLQHHPSIAVWAGNNENEVALSSNWYGTKAHFEKYKSDYIELYVDTIKPIVNAYDSVGKYVISSPSNGIKSIEEGYIAQNPYDIYYGDTHYYNYFADSWDMKTFPKTRFASEYGIQSIPSVDTLKKVISNKHDLEISSEFMQHRQHSPGGYENIQLLVDKHLKKLNDTHPDHFKLYVYQSQIAQAMAIKAQSEFYRQSQHDWYTMGALYWQLNDVWQAPSWSSIEYGGKWKMLHYFAKRFFSPILITTNVDVTGKVNIFLINDRFASIENANITVDVFEWKSLVPVKTFGYTAKARALTAELQPFGFNINDIDHNREFLLRFSFQSNEDISSPYNYLFPNQLKELPGRPKPDIKIVFRRTQKTDRKGDIVYDGYVITNAIVLFFWMEANDLDGRFEDNGLILTDRVTTIRFISKTRISPEKLNNITFIHYPC